MPERPTTELLSIALLDKATEEHLLRRANASTHATKLVTDARAERRDIYSKSYLRMRISIAQALFDSGKLTQAEYFFHTVCPVETYYEGRPGRRELSPELVAISNQMREVERRYGLKENEYWKLTDAPEEYLALSARYDEVSDHEFATALDDAGLDEAARLWRSDRDKYDALREFGRRCLFEAENLNAAIATCVEHFEREADTCCAASAYYASCIMLGSAAEGCLLLACLKNGDAVEAARLRLPASHRPRKDPLDWRFDHLIRVATEVGWLPQLESDRFVFDTGNLLHRLREIRNLLHPGRHIRAKPHVQIGRETYDDALAAYKVLCRLLDHKPQPI
jgi:hypothetical protein